MSEQLHTKETKNLITPQDLARKVGMYVRNSLLLTAIGLKLALPGAVQADGLTEQARPEFNILAPKPTARNLPLDFEVKEKSSSATLIPDTYEAIPCSEEHPRTGNIIEDTRYEVKKFLIARRARFMKETLNWKLTEPDRMPSSQMEADEVCLKTEKVETVEGISPTCPNSDKKKYKRITFTGMSEETVKFPSETVFEADVCEGKNTYLNQTPGTEGLYNLTVNHTYSYKINPDWTKSMTNFRFVINSGTRLPNMLAIVRRTTPEEKFLSPIPDDQIINAKSASVSNK